MMTERACFVLSVNDIVAERAFYRDVVGLGDPAMNSNVWVEFRLDGACSFCLEQAAANKAHRPAQGRTCFLFFVDSVDEFRKRYLAVPFSGASEGSPCEQTGYRAVQYSDPEGNLFRVTDKRHC